MWLTPATYMYVWTANGDEIEFRTESAQLDGGTQTMSCIGYKTVHDIVTIVKCKLGIWYM